jgi:hypothetical protein
MISRTRLGWMLERSQVRSRAWPVSNTSALRARRPAASWAGLACFMKTPDTQVALATLKEISWSRMFGAMQVNAVPGAAAYRASFCIAFSRTKLRIEHVMPCLCRLIARAFKKAQRRPAR